MLVCFPLRESDWNVLIGYVCVCALRLFLSRGVEFEFWRLVRIGRWMIECWGRKS